MTREHLRILLPVLSLAILLAAVFYLQPRAMSYFGLNLLFNLAIPVALATIAQMMIIMVNDIDLSIGTFVSFCACVTATLVQEHALAGLTWSCLPLFLSTLGSARSSICAVYPLLW